MDLMEFYYGTGSFIGPGKLRFIQLLTTIPGVATNFLLINLKVDFAYYTNLQFNWLYLFY